jgi:hypothetical protein
MDHSLYTDFNLKIDTNEFIGILGSPMMESVRGEINLNGEERILSKKIFLLNKILEKNHGLFLDIARKNVSNYFNFRAVSVHTSGFVGLQNKEQLIICELDIHIKSTKNKQIMRCDYELYQDLKRYFKYVGIVHRFKITHSTSSYYHSTSLSDVLTIPISIFAHKPKTYEQLKAEELYANRINETLELPLFNPDELIEPKKKKKFWLF